MLKIGLPITKKKIQNFTFIFSTKKKHMFLTLFDRKNILDSRNILEDNNHSIDEG